jgi:hypothetical protein
MAHDPAFGLQPDLLNTAFDLGSVVSSLPESIDYQAEMEADAPQAPDPAKLAMIQSARALLADAEQKLMRFQNKKLHLSSADKKKKLEQLQDAVIQAEVWLNTLINS